MSLFAHRQEYQRSIDKIMEDFSIHSPAPTEPSPEEAENNLHRSVMNQGNQRERFSQQKIPNHFTPRVPDRSELIQYDVKAWGRFLDGKRKD